MTHGFDDLGRHFDKFGNNNNWWSNQSLIGFDDHASCFIQQYNNYRLTDKLSVSQFILSHGSY